MWQLGRTVKLTVWKQWLLYNDDNLERLKILYSILDAKFWISVVELEENNHYAHSSVTSLTARRNTKEEVQSFVFKMTLPHTQFLSVSDCVYNSCNAWISFWENETSRRKISIACERNCLVQSKMDGIKCINELLNQVCAYLSISSLLALLRRALVTSFKQCSRTYE